MWVEYDMQQFDGFTLCGYLFKTCQHQRVDLEQQTDSGLGGFHQLKNVVFIFGKAFLLKRTKIRQFIKYHILNYFNWVKFLPFCVSTMGHSKKNNTTYNEKWRDTKQFWSIKKDLNSQIFYYCPTKRLFWDNLWALVILLFCFLWFWFVRTNLLFQNSTRWLCILKLWQLVIKMFKTENTSRGSLRTSQSD